MKKLVIVKIGGNVIDDENKLSLFLKDFAAITDAKLLIHGGGKLATSLAEKLNIPQQLVEGRRITDAETLKIITMVYAGLINKNIVAKLQSCNANAIGMCGADGNIIQAHKRINATTDYGYAGDIDLVNTSTLDALLHLGTIPVIAPVTHDNKGQLLNTNADTIAQELAQALSHSYYTTLIYCFEKSGVLKDVNNDESVIRKITPEVYQNLKDQQAVFAGMIPKLDNAFKALSKGVKKIAIGKAEDIHQLIKGGKGTTIVEE